MDENCEDYRVDVDYRMVIVPWHARSYIEGGRKSFCGFAIDAAQASGVTEVGDFIDLFCGAIAPAQLSPSEPIRILEVLVNPFVQTSRAVGALHPGAFPVAILKCLAQIKVPHVLQGQSASLAYALSVFRGDLENTGMTPLPSEYPSMLEHIASEDQQEELEYSPVMKGPGGLGASWTDEDRTGRAEPLNRGRRTTNLDKASETMKIENANSMSEGAQ